jgi:hypothetical protein
MSNLSRPRKITCTIFSLPSHEIQETLRQNMNRN